MRINCKTTLFIIFIGSLFSDNLFGARSLTPPPGYEQAIADGDDEKEDNDACAKKVCWSNVAAAEQPPALSNLWRTPNLYPYWMNQVINLKKSTILFCLDQKFFTYCRQSGAVHAADPLETPNFIGHSYEPATQTHLSLIDTMQKYIFDIASEDGTRNILPSNRDGANSGFSLGPLALSPDRKILAYRFFKTARMGGDNNSTVAILDTLTGREIGQFYDRVTGLTFLSNFLLHTGNYIYDVRDKSLREDHDSCHDKFNLGDDQYAGIIARREGKGKTEEIVFKKTINGSFDDDTTLQKILSHNATIVRFTAPNRLLLGNHNTVRFFEGTPVGKKLRFRCRGQIKAPPGAEQEDLYPLSSQNSFLINSNGTVCEITPETRLTPLTEEQEADPFNLE